ncbi:MAG TPA: hypothetical protein IAD08_03770 [Candidatus Scatovivens faecipullorum]|nr:hypothetical protein [Candidatus Scatovivens faecipullorum]
MNNIVQKHISDTQKRFKKYFSMILKSKYDREVADELIQAYIDSRYYNYEVNNTIRIFHRRIYEAIKVKAETLRAELPDKIDIIDYTQELFQYFFYFDYVRKNVEISKVIKLISEKREKKYNLRNPDTKNFIKEFSNLVESDLNKINHLLKLYDSTKDFEITLKKLDDTMYRVKLLYNFDFPEIFSKEIIEETFETDVIGEDRLFVEYPMIANEVLKEILNGNFSRIYVVDFAESLLKKKKKLEQLLEILENQAAQDKIYFEIKFEDFVKNKKEVFEIIKRGFKFALVTNSEMPKFTKDELQITEVFGCIFADTNDVNKKRYKNDKILEI